MSSQARKARRQAKSGKRGSQQGRLAQAIADHKAGRIAAAEAGYEAVLGAQPYSVPALQYLGVIRGEAGDFERALALLDTAARKAPTNAEVLSNQAVAKRQAGDYAGAHQAARKALQFEPDNSSARYTRGIAARALGNLGEAAETFDKLLAQLGEHADVLIERAEVALAQDDRDGAADYLGRATDRLMTMAKPVAQRVRAADGLVQIGDLDRAEALLNHSFAHQGELPDGDQAAGQLWRSLARVRAAQGLPEAARAADEQAAIAGDAPDPAESN